MTDDENDRREKGLELAEDSASAPGDAEVEILSISAREPEGEAGESAPAENEPEAATASRLSADLAAARESHLRLLADFDNFRKRMERDREGLRRHVLFDQVRDLLPVADNLERALAAQGTLEDLRRGVEMTLRQLHDGLRRLGVAEVPALGEPFDPRMHEAVAHREDPAVDAPTVAAELQRGYLLHDRLLRPALVVVASPPEPAGAVDEARTETTEDDGPADDPDRRGA